jgi:hypothetical protein
MIIYINGPKKTNVFVISYILRTFYANYTVKWNNTDHDNIDPCTVYIFDNCYNIPKLDNYHDLIITEYIISLRKDIKERIDIIYLSSPNKVLSEGYTFQEHVEKYKKYILKDF